MSEEKKIEKATATLQTFQIWGNEETLGDETDRKSVVADRYKLCIELVDQIKADNTFKVCWKWLKRCAKEDGSTKKRWIVQTDLTVFGSYGLKCLSKIFQYTLGLDGLGWSFRSDSHYID